jgi:hypothetical protein
MKMFLKSSHASERQTASALKFRLTRAMELQRKECRSAFLIPNPELYD